MPKTIKHCSVEECQGRPIGRGYCSKHYQRLMRHGSTDARQVPSESERFWAKVDKTGECWNWTAATYGNGYGHFGVSADRGAIAHRYAWEQTNGTIPAGALLDHMCHNRACVNPQHLRIVTQKQNIENVGVLRTDNTSGVRGVHRHSNGRHWVARVQHHGEQHDAGLFLDLADAEAAVIAKRNELFTHNDMDRKTA